MMNYKNNVILISISKILIIDYIKIIYINNF